MLRFVVYAVPLLVLLLALFGFTVELLDFEPRSGSVIKLALFEQPQVPGQLILGTWLVEASGLIALFLLAQGRFAAWWMDGLVAGWVAWIFRGPLLVITIVVAARQPQDPWWTLAFGWWVLYSICGLSLAILARRSDLGPWQSPVASPKVSEALVSEASVSQTMDSVAIAAEDLADEDEAESSGEPEPSDEPEPSGGSEVSMEPVTSGPVEPSKEAQ